MKFTDENAKSLLKIIKKNGFNPKFFSILEKPYEGYPEITYKWSVHLERTSFSFDVVRKSLSTKDFTVFVCPAEIQTGMFHITDGSLSPIFLKRYIEYWLSAIKYISSDRFWSDDKVSVFNENKSGNDYEIEDVKLIVEHLKKEVMKANMSSSQKKILLLQLDLTLKLYKENKDFDWKAYIFGIITSAVVNMTIDTDTGKHLLSGAKVVLHKLLEH